MFAPVSKVPVALAVFCAAEGLRMVWGPVLAHETDVAEAAATASCKNIASRYRPLANAHFGTSPLTVLVHSPTSGIRVSEPVAAPLDLTGWARMQDPPFDIADDLQEAWVERRASSRTWELNRLPDTDFYSLSSVQGTAHCIYSLYFEVKSGRAQLASAPAAFEDASGASCGVGRAYGLIDKHAALFQEMYDYTPSMSSTLTVATWENGRFVPGCILRFSFAPAFGSETWNVHKESCDAPDCEALRRAAFRLAADVQKSPLTARAELLASLSPVQRTEYDSTERVAAAHPPTTATDPATITEQSPLRVPYVSAGRLYVASIGHFTVGWRYFSDWSVRFDALENGSLVPRAAFAVGMKKGQLEEVAVLPISRQETR